MGRNLTNLTISSSFQYLLQVSESNSVNNGVGSVITDLAVTASHATNAVSSSFASNALTADNATFATSANSATTATTANTASYYADAVVTSSAAGSTITFTKADGSTYDNTISTATANTASLALRNVLTSSAVNDTITFTKGDGTTYTNTINNVSSSLSAQEIFVIAKNVQGSTIPKGYAVHSSGVTGENINITTASYDNPNIMPAIGITQEEIASNATGEVIISGRLRNVNTSGLIAGRTIYVNGDGSLTSTRPTGSALIQNIGTCAKSNATEGEIIVVGAGRSNDLPNLTTDYVWKGDSDGVPQAVAESTLDVNSASTATSASHAVQADNATSASYAVTSSHVTDPNIAYTNVNNSFTGTQTFNNIAVNGTGSFAYLESVTGSAKIIGDNYLILNNDSPTQRYAGIKVIDSGSSAATASLNFDGSTNDWFYEYTSSGDPDNFGVVMFGPEYNTIGSPTYNTANTLVKADGGHHLLDSNITDNGSTVSIGADVSITGGLVSTGSSVNLVSTIPGNFQIQKALQYPSVDSVLRGHTYGTNFIGMLDYSAVSPRYDKALIMAKGNSDAFTYSGLIYNSGYDLGFYLDSPSGSIAQFDMVVNNNATGDIRSVYYAQQMDIGANGGNRTTQINIGLNGTFGNEDINLAAKEDITIDSPIISVTGSLQYQGRTRGEVNALTITSNTASIDGSVGDYFTLTLVSGSDTHIAKTNIENGQTIILKTKQPAVGFGTTSYELGFAFSEGTRPTATPSADAEDIITIVGLDNLQYVTAVLNMQQ